MKNGTKQEILDIVKKVEQDLKTNNNTTIFSESGNRNKIGCNQFREIAAECRVAECYDEILLLVEYTIAKSNEWKEKEFDKTILSAMKKVRNIGKPKEQGNETNDENRRELYNLELFFGYMYWESRILAANNPSGGQSNNKYNNNQKGNYQNNKKSPNQKFNGNTKSDGSFRKKGN